MLLSVVVVSVASLVSRLHRGRSRGRVVFEFVVVSLILV